MKRFAEPARLEGLHFPGFPNIPKLSITKKFSILRIEPLARLRGPGRTGLLAFYLRAINLCQQFGRARRLMAVLILIAGL
jgi:hypothetical protein